MKTVLATTAAAALALAGAVGACPEHDSDGHLEARQAKATGALAGYFDYDVYPKAQAENVTKYIAAAKAYARDDVYPYYARDCNFYSANTKLDSAGNHDGLAPATEVFKDFYFVGLSSWTAWAYDTGDGLIIYDTLASAAEAENIILPGLAKFGFTGKDIKYVFISHEHFDHYGGAKYLQDNFDPIIVASKDTWAAMEKLPATADPAPPVRNAKAITVTKDGSEITLGNVTTTMYLTPGHTNGTMSYILPVTDSQTGEKMLAGMYGGSGASSTAWSLGVQATQLVRWADLSRKKGVKAFVSNHHSRDHSLYHIEEYAHRVCDPKGRHCNFAHPWVHTPDWYYRWAMMGSYCIRAQAARGGFILSQ
ncbi:beta-lactamase-like protein [Microdochium trichocladiopsis]|uniref:Beta-lactamase-like protein n=1 Tax=Microdochium trichocladiopsis TaxID=1682393 RepID=A0A9P9BP62_9PEZI|nr:beta-lactamase-like protein [Microdochium trichocladiopsis]KAH7028944.1 beta-lactamase-like protein [Microdochium trichocladiopsis]